MVLGGNSKFTPGNILIILYILFYTTVTHAGDWSYEGHTGPHNWPDLFPDGCSGRKQSPININTMDTIEDPGLKDFALWYDPPKPGSRFTIINNGHTVQVNTIGEFFVTNGGLPDVYSTAQFHFHWGHHKLQGSEHKIDGKTSPIELHVVNYNSDKYDNIVDAMVEPRGLAVLGVLFEVSERDNPVLEPLVYAMERVKDPEFKPATPVEIPAIPIRDLLPEDTTKYFRYNGSLTTPGCFESVIWTLFTERQTISHRQLMKFRRLLKPKHERRNRKHKGMTRKERQRRAAAEEVMEEVGIKGDMKEEIHLLEEMKNKANKEHGTNGNHSDADDHDHTSSHGNVVKPTIGEAPDKFHLYEDESPDLKLEKVKPTVNENAEQQHVEKHADEHESEWIEIEWEKFDISPDNIVNNFRPVQPLNDRKVLRSFSLDRVKEKKVAYILSDDDDNNNNNNGAGTLSYLSLVILMMNIFLGLFAVL